MFISGTSMGASFHRRHSYELPISMNINRNENIEEFQDQQQNIIEMVEIIEDLREQISGEHSDSNSELNEAVIELHNGNFIHKVNVVMESAV